MQDVLQIIEEAGARAGIPPVSNDSYQLEQAVSSLNLILQNWYNETNLLNLYTEREPIPLLKGVHEYFLPNDIFDIHTASIRGADIGRDQGLTRISIEEYTRVPNKMEPGFPHQFLYDRQVDDPRIIFWLVPDRDGYEFYYWSKDRYPELDVDNLSGLPNITYQQHEALNAELAVRLCEKFNFDPNKISYLKQLAMQAYDNMVRENSDGSVLNISSPYGLNQWNYGRAL